VNSKQGGAELKRGRRVRLGRELRSNPRSPATPCVYGRGLDLEEWACSLGAAQLRGNEQALRTCSSSMGTL
jgi:hypothetical protein